MSLPSYQVMILDPVTGQISALLDQSIFLEMRFSRVLNGIGAIAMTLPGDSPYRSAFVLDAFIEVYRTHPTSGDLAKEETYLTRLTNRFRSGDEELFVVGGLSLNHLLARRIVDPDDDPLEAGGYSTKDGAADEVIRAYAREQIGDLASAERQISTLSIPPVGGVGLPVGARLRHENLLAAIQGMTTRGMVDFVIERSTGTNMIMTIAPIGSDKTQTNNYPFTPWVGLSPARGNLTAPNLMLDRKEEQNFIYALGQGQGVDRTLLKVAGDGTTDSPFNRVEFVQDARNIKKGDALGLLTEARAMLREKQAKKEFSFEPTGLEPGNIYHVDWDMGDTVTIIWDEDEFDFRIMSVELSISPSGETMTVKMEPA